jgi:hypothetical protein
MHFQTTVEVGAPAGNLWQAVADVFVRLEADGLKRCAEDWTSAAPGSSAPTG